MAESAPRAADQPTIPIVASVVWGLAFFPGAFVAMFALAFQDAPKTAHNSDWESVAVFASFPILCLVSIALSWMVWALRKEPAKKPQTAQIAVACLPLLPVVFVMVLWVAAFLGATLKPH